MSKRQNKLVVRITEFNESWVELRSSNGRVLMISAIYKDSRPSDSVVRILTESNFETIVVDDRKA